MLHLEKLNLTVFQFSGTLARSSSTRPILSQFLEHQDQEIVGFYALQEGSATDFKAPEL